MHIGFMFVFFFQERLFKSSFLRQLYQVTARLKPNQQKLDENKFVKYIDTHDVLSEGFLKQILEYLLRRSRLSYGYNEILHYITHCMCLRKPKEHTKNTSYFQK